MTGGTVGAKWAIPRERGRHGRCSLPDQQQRLERESDIVSTLLETRPDYTTPDHSTRQAMPKQQTQPKHHKAASASAPSDGWEDAKLQAELDAMILENAAITAAKEAEQKAAAPPPAPPAVKVRRCCQKCQGDNPTLMCPLCKSYYCSAACQAAHWPLHKEQCGLIAGRLDDYAGAKAHVKDREGDASERAFNAALMGRLSDCERIIFD